MAFSRRQWAWVPALMALAAAAPAADLCADKSAWPDSAICKDSAVAGADEQLNAIYRYVRDSSADKDALRNEQRQWLRTVRNACTREDCLLKVYRQRVAELAARFAGQAEVSDQPLSNDQARQACEAVAQLAGKGELQNLEIPPVANGASEPDTLPAQWAVSPAEQAALEANGSRPMGLYLLPSAAKQAPRRFVEFFTGGSCASFQIFDLAHALKGGDNPEASAVEAVDDPDEALRWAYAGAGDYPIIYQQHLFLVASGLDRNQAGLLSWVKPDGVVRPLCLFEQTRTTQAVSKAALPQLCGQIANGSLAVLPWKDVTAQTRPEDRESFIERYGDRAERVFLLQLDLDGDGKAENIGRFEYDSGAGCGSTDIWLRLLSEDLSRALDTPLGKSLADLSGGSLDIYKAGGRPYFAGSDGRHRAGIVQLNAGKAEQVCEFKPLTQRVVSKFFPVTP